MPRPSPIGPLVALAAMLAGCDRADSPAPPARGEEPAPLFRNITATTAYVGDAGCSNCHVNETRVYRQHAMASSFHPWSNATRIETPLDTPLYHAPTGFHYGIVESDGRPHQVEYIIGPGGKRIHELRRRMDYVMGSGSVARTYFTQENGRLFQLPLTWYRDHGWDFSPGYEINNARFDRVMPDACIACHSSYPRPEPHLEGKYAELRPGIGCERCHGPGALHVSERRGATRISASLNTARDTMRDTTRTPSFDNSIVNPARLPLERRLDVCEQCHVHTSVAVLREGRDAFSFKPSQTLEEQSAFFKPAGGIDIVSHADRLRQSACFIATRTTSGPLECATCHNPHEPAPTPQTRNAACQRCHVVGALQQRLANSAARTDHSAGTDCMTCHMPTVRESGVPHGTFTDHWIRVVSRRSAPATSRRASAGPVQAYYDRDRTGPDAALYQRLGEIVYATRASDGAAMAAATAALDRSLGTDTTHGEARFLLGAAYQQLGRPNDAIRVLTQSVRADSNRPDRLHALAQAYERIGHNPAVGQSPTVEGLYRRALTLQPALAWIRLDYADFLHAEGRVADAEREYRTALAEQPSLAVGWFNLGTLLAGQDRLRQSADAFRAAVRLDPQLAEGLARLVEVRTDGRSVGGARKLEIPLTTLPVRERGPRAAQLSVGETRPAVQLLNVPPRGIVQIVEPNGTLVRVLRANESIALEWDLLTESGRPVAAGLYQARVLGLDASRRPLRPQVLHFGIVRRNAR